MQDIIIKKDKENNGFEVIQGRGINNSNTPKHDEIIRLVNNNMDLIRKAI